MKIAGRSYLSGLRARGIAAVLQFLTRDVVAELPECSNDTARLYRYLRRGDVVLVEGHSRVSHFIKYATQSQWTHTALYVGDELLRRGDRLREQTVAAFGASADRLIVEALLGEGVVVAPLEKYRAHTVRICRPHAIEAADLDQVIHAVLADLGKRYDTRNLLELAAMQLFPIRLGPFKPVPPERCLGRCTGLEVICSGMIAGAFYSVGYPVLPALGSGAVDLTDDELRRVPMIGRHPSQVLPRDFDLSPNFQIIKPGLRRHSRRDCARGIRPRSDARPSRVTRLTPLAPARSDDRPADAGEGQGPARHESLTLAM